METLTPPVIPSLSGRGKQYSDYPTPTSRLGRAWAHAWAILTDLPAGEMIDGNELARDVAGKVSPKLAPVTMTQLFARMGRAGALLEEKRPTVGTRGVRPRSFYRVNPDRPV